MSLPSMVTSRMNGTGTYMETEDRPGAAHTQWLGAKASYRRMLVNFTPRMTFGNWL
ncbi:MAG: hypothetical protein QOF56_3934 [Acidobacteriaceae bacterium]|nr:hypothetical protein [Acidobacteriaceae bacterium]